MMEYIPAKSIITTTKNPSSWFGTEYNMNIYRGCSHGCIYCDSRSECYRIKDFNTVCAKENALQIIRDQLRRKTRTGVIATGAMSDPYNPMEARFLLTRHALELCNAFGFGVSIATKSKLLERDMDILTDIKEHSPVICKITITTPKDELSKKIEPYAAPSSQRFELIRKLSERDIFSGILLMPVLPFIEDNESSIIELIEKAHENGAKFIYPMFGVTLRANQQQYFYEQLNKQFKGQGLVEKYQKQFGNTYECRSPKAKKLYELIKKECTARKIYYRMNDIIYAYKHSYRIEQLNLFGEKPL